MSRTYDCISVWRDTTQHQDSDESYIVSRDDSATDRTDTYSTHSTHAGAWDAATSLADDEGLPVHDDIDGEDYEPEKACTHGTVSDPTLYGDGQTYYVMCMWCGEQIELDGIQLVRSDQGDGGWSLHPASASDEEIAEGTAPILASGTATWDEGAGTWDRPDDDDEQDARRALAGIATGL